MAKAGRGQTRRDSKRRVLRPGESIRADGKYQYKYHIAGKPHFVYSWKLEPTDKLPKGKKPCLSLRELEKQVNTDLDLLVNIVDGQMTVCELVDRYLKTKTGVRQSTKVVYILFHTGMRISEFCGLTLKDIDLENRTVNIDHQLQRTSDMRYIIENTKTDAGTRVLPITEDVAQMFQAIIEDRNAPKVEKSIDGYSGFLFYDDNGMPLVAMHWQHRFNRMVGRYNDIYRVQMPNITPHVCRHTYARIWQNQE